MKLAELLSCLYLGNLEENENLSFIKLYDEKECQNRQKRKEEVTIIVYPCQKMYSRLEELVTFNPDEEIRKMSITETGDVNSLDIRNQSEKYLFIPGGTVFDSRSQKRAAAYPSLIAPYCHTRISVFCVEEGQGLIKSEAFRTRAASIAMATLRTNSVQKKAIREYQPEVWREISHTLTSSGLTSHTSNYQNLAKSVYLRPYLAGLDLVEKGQVGYIAAISTEEKVKFYLDLFGSRQIYHWVSNGFCESIALTAKVYSKRRKSTVKKEEFIKYLCRLGKAELGEEKEFGTAGSLYLIDSPEIQGNCLFYHQNLLQLSASN